MKKCPYCAEEIQDEVIKCRYCGQNLAMRINRIVPNSIASSIGLKKDDVLLLIDNKVTDSSKSIDKIKEKIELARQFNINILRDREPLILEATFTKDKVIGIHFDGKGGGTTLSKGKIEEAGGCGCAIASFLIPGLGQFIKGEALKGTVYLIIALVIGVPTLWIGGIIVALISAVDASGPVYKCLKCRSIVEREATKCKNCGADLG